MSEQRQFSRHQKEIIGATLIGSYASAAQLLAAGVPPEMADDLGDTSAHLEALRSVILDAFQVWPELASEPGLSLDLLKTVDPAAFSQVLRDAFFKV